MSLSLTPPDSENVILALGVPSKTKSTEEGVRVLEDGEFDKEFEDDVDRCEMV